MTTESAVSTAVTTNGARSGWLRRLWGQKSLFLGCSLALILIVGSFIITWIRPDPSQQHLEYALSPPGTNGYPFGSDPLGRDVLAWCAAGIQTAGIVSAAVVLISATFGAAVGLVAGYFGGWLDAVLMRIVDLQLAIPPILLFLAASTIVEPSTFNLIVLLSIAGWVPYARVVRTKTQSERERPYIAAARLSGAGHLRILVTNLLPAVASTLLVLGSLSAGYVVLWESGLSFLGLGIRPPRASLGYMISQGRNLLTTSWWIVTLPGIAVVLVVLAFNLIGDGLRDRAGLDARTDL
jgi:peptide/nickel transport system permease protein